MKNISIVLLTVVFLFLPPNMATATEVRGAESQGKVGFIGDQEPTGSPNPKPPKGDAIKPIGRLPQTNYITNPLLTITGISLVSGAIIFWKKN